MYTHNRKTGKPRDGRRASLRPAFTLVEMIVVLTIMLVLTVIVAAVAPRFQENQRVVKGADLISQWLLTAKQMALRNQTATGVRFNPDPTNSSLVRELQYIQQPDDFIAIPGVSPQPGTTIPYPIRRISPGVWLAGATGYSWAGNLALLEPPQVPQPWTDFSGGFTNPPSPQLWPVQQGDFLEANGSGLVHQIIGISTPPSPYPQEYSLLQLASPFSPQPGQAPTTVTLPLLPGPLTSQYRVIRAPRVLTGETPLQLPKDVAIDANQKFPGDPFGFTPPIDILFSPSGSVVSPAGVSGKIIFWVRDTGKDPSEPGEQFLVVIQVRTGFIAVHPADPYSSNLNMYRFAFDDRTSGL
jgi:prepilin-type N-terminal cleavage/methylation domain-containing protein